MTTRRLAALIPAHNEAYMLDLCLRDAVQRCPFQDYPGEKHLLILNDAHDPIDLGCAESVSVRVGVCAAHADHRRQAGGPRVWLSPPYTSG